MKNTYMTPAVKFEAVEVKDVITTSLIEGGEGGSVYATVDIGAMFLNQ